MSNRFYSTQKRSKQLLKTFNDQTLNARTLRDNLDSHSMRETLKTVLSRKTVAGVRCGQVHAAKAFVSPVEVIVEGEH